MPQLVAVILENNPLDHRQTNNSFMYYKSDVKSRGLFARQGFLQIAVQDPVAHKALQCH